MFARAAIERWLVPAAAESPREAPGEVWPGERGWAADTGIVWYWYDLLCPFSYVVQDVPQTLRRQGLQVIGLPLQLYPGIPPGGAEYRGQDQDLREVLERDAREAGLELRWPKRLPCTRPALAAVEWVRQHEPSAFASLQRALFHAHFVAGEDIERPSVIEAHAGAVGVHVPFLRAALADGSAYAAITRARKSAEFAGVRHTPAWLGD